MFYYGLVVGKFSPLTKGHEYLLKYAYQNSARLVVICSTSRADSFGYPAETRRMWLKDLLPNAEVYVVDHMCPDDFAPDFVHREFTADLLINLGYKDKIDAIFCSESYGPGFRSHLAGRFGRDDIMCVILDENRLNIPISATMVRESPAMKEIFCNPVVKRPHAKRILFIGAESSGKSTICQELFDHFEDIDPGHYAYTTEYGRDLCEIRGGVQNLSFEDYSLIGEKQVSLEEKYMKMKGIKYIFCDTSPLVTEFYCAQQYGIIPVSLSILADRKYDHIFFCERDFPYVDDGTRAGVEFGDKQEKFYKTALKQPYTVLRGSVEERIATVKATLETISAENKV